MLIDFNYPAVLATFSFSEVQMNTMFFLQLNLYLYGTRRRVPLDIHVFIHPITGHPEHVNKCVAVLACAACSLTNISSHSYHIVT